MSENGTNGNGNTPASHGKPLGNNGNGFKPGQSGNPHGRASKKLERDYFNAAKKVVTTRKWQRIVKKALADAEGGAGIHPVAVAKARDFLLKALSLEQAVKVQVSGSLDSDEGRRRLVLDAQDPATLALVADLANRVYGPKGPPPAAPTNGNGNGSHG